MSAVAVPPAQDLAFMLESMGGLSGVFYSRLPDSPDAAVAVIDRSGIFPRFTHSGSGIERPRAQIICRDINHAKAWMSASVAWKLLRRYNFSIGDNHYLAVEPVDSVADLGEDEDGRRLVGFNVQIHKEV